MNRKRSFAFRLAVFCLACSLPVAAEIIISVSANGPEGGSSVSDSFTSSSAHGSAYAGIGSSGSAAALPGLGLGPCLLGQVANVAAQSCAAADGSSGMLRAGSYSNANLGSDAVAQVFMDDIVTFASGTAVFNIHLDFDFGASGTGYSALVFKILQATGFSDEPYLCIYCFSVTPEGWELTKPGPFIFPIITFGQGNPAPVDDLISFAMPGPLALRIMMIAETSCGNEGLPCSAFADAQHTAYIGIPTAYTSSNDYSYRGFVTADVPEPRAVLLCLAGLAALWARRRQENRYAERLQSAPAPLSRVDDVALVVFVDADIIRVRLPHDVHHGSFLFAGTLRAHDHPFALVGFYLGLRSALGAVRGEHRSGDSGHHRDRSREEWAEN